jgi:hypothetical protein
MPSTIEITPAQLENVNRVLQELTSLDSGGVESKLVKASGPELEGNNRPVRVPFQLWHPLGGAKFSPDGGALPRGLATAADAYFGGHIPFAHTFELTLAQKDMNALSTIDTTKEVFGRTTEMIAVKNDIMFHGDGSGILAGAAGGSTTSNVVINGVTKTTYTFPANDPIGLVNLVEGLPVEVVASNLTTRRAPASGSEITFVEKVDYFTNTVILNQEVATPAAGDVLVWPGLFAPNPGAGFVAGYSGASPLTSFNQGWPTTQTAAGTGMTGDPFRHGYLYAINTDPTSWFYGKRRSEFPQLQCNRLNVNGPFQFTQAVQVMNQMQYRRPAIADTTNFVGLISPAQYLAAFQAGQSVVTNMREIGDVYGKTIDAAPNDSKYRDSVSINGITTYKDRRAPKNQLVFLVPEGIGKVVGKKIEIFNPSGSGNGYMALPTTNGTYSTNILMVMVDSWDYLYFDPGRFCVLNGLTVPNEFSVA